MGNIKPTEVFDGQWKAVSCSQIIEEYRWVLPVVPAQEENIDIEKIE